jgi:hypothetical protein
MLARARAYATERAAERKAARDKRKGRCEHCRESMPVQRGTRKMKQGVSGAVRQTHRAKNKAVLVQSDYPTAPKTSALNLTKHI